MITSFSDHIRVFNDSNYPYLFGGSKARKLKFILNNAKSKNANAVVSAGSASSNHARDCALACAQLGWPCTLIIHDREDYTKTPLSTYFSKVLVYLVFKISVKTIRILNSIKIKSLR